MGEKKCFNCEHMNFCGMYKGLIDMAHMLNNNLDIAIDEKNGFESMRDLMAHDCKRFKRID